MEYYSIDPSSFRYISHHGILGQKWGIRRFQNKDGSLTKAGKDRLESERSSKFHTREKKIGEGSASVEKGRKVETSGPIGTIAKTNHTRSTNFSHHSGHFEHWSLDNAKADYKEYMLKRGLKYSDYYDQYDTMYYVYAYCQYAYTEEEYKLAKKNHLNMLNENLMYYTDQLNADPKNKELQKKYNEALKQYNDAVKQFHKDMRDSKRINEANMLMDHSIENVVNTSGWKERVSKELDSLKKSDVVFLSSSGNEVVSEKKDDSTQFFTWNEEWDKYN